MEHLQVKVDFTRFSDPRLGTIAAGIAGKMTGNANFPELATDVAELQAVNADYLAALAAAPKGTSLDRVIKNSCRKAVELVLHDMGVKINLKARGHEQLLESTGYPLVSRGGTRKAAGVAGPLGKIEGIRFRRLEGAGAVRARIARQRGAASYTWMYTLAPVTEESVWTTVQTSSTICLFAGLALGGRYAFKVAGVGKDPRLVFSDVAYSYAI